MWALVAHDYGHIAEDVNSFGGRLEAMGPVITSLIQTVDSRQSLAETANLSRLTYLALVFVPLTFVSSLFSMAGDTGPGRRAFWIYFAVAIPLLCLVFLIARPRQSGLSQIIEFIHGLSRRCRRRLRREVVV